MKRFTLLLALLLVCSISFGESLRTPSTSGAKKDLSNVDADATLDIAYLTLTGFATLPAIQVGVAGAIAGQIFAYGDGTNGGGLLSIYNGDNYDTTVDNYWLTAYLGNLLISRAGTFNDLILSQAGNVLIGTTTDDTVNKLQVAGFTKLGEAATGVKCKIINGTTGAAEGDAVTVTHGLTGDKIVGWTSKVYYLENAGVGPEYSFGAEYQYSVFHDGTNFSLSLSATNSSGLLSKAFSIMIWYVE